MEEIGMIECPTCEQQVSLMAKRRCDHCDSFVPEGKAQTDEVHE